MLTSSSTSRKPVKQGWILKKGGMGVLAPWRPKYLALFQGSGGKLTLNVYDNIDQSSPKHEIDTSNMRVEMKAVKFALLSRNAVPFTIYTRSRKFYFAASTLQEYEDWIGAINSSKEMAFRPVSTRPKTSMDNSDARSVYSLNSRADDNDDTMSVASGYSRATYHAGVEGGSSTVDTLSFSSEPVLTSHELYILGQENAIESIDSKTQSQFVKRRVPGTNLQNASEESIGWHSKFIELLESRTVTEDQALQKDVQLMEHIGAFQELASYHARNIIDEYHISGTMTPAYKMNQDKTIKKENMIFRFACDYDVASPEEIQEAISKTSAELRALNATIKAVASNPNDAKCFFTILMALIDYKGFRMVVHADLTISTQIVSIHDLNPKRLQINDDICNETQSIAHALNLTSHTVQVHDDRRVRVPLAATVEIHLDTKSNRHYLSCLRDIFPIDYFTTEAAGLKAIQQGDINPNLNHRLRPEFLQVYQNTVCADVFTPASGATRREKETNDEEGMKAARFLRENWIPSFIKSLDNMDIRPYDSESLTTLMHCKGINMRYLGVICRYCTIPFVRTMILVEMIARVCKRLFQARLRGAILHFRSVGATSIEDQMFSYTANMLSVILGFSERTAQFLQGKIIPELQRKFDFQMILKDYLDVPRPALFLSIQYHCGITFEDHTDYDFSLEQCIPKNRLISFESRVKTLSGTQLITYPLNARDDNRLAYAVARHFKSLGPKSKLQHLNSSAAVLNFVACYYNSNNHFDEAKLYAQAAAASAQKNHCLFGLASAQLLYAVSGLQATGLTGPEPSLLGWYGKALSIVSWHWGSQNPLCMTIYDRMSTIYHRAKDPIRAFEFHKQSLDVSDQSLGNNHTITAAYYTRAGCYLANMGKSDEAIRIFTQALSIFSSTRADPSVIAEVHYHFADALAIKGDYDKAVEHAQKCRKMRESAFGFSDIRVIHSCRQVAKLIREPYKDYNGVMTTLVKAAYREAISCHEKVFRYLQNQQGINKRRSIRRSHSTNSVALSFPNRYHPGTETQLVMAGPLVVSPLGWTPPFAKNLLHKLTKEIVAMKLALVEIPKQKECIRMLRTRRSQEVGNDDSFDPEDARETVMKMAAVTPSVYLDDVMQRITDGDDSAIHELGLVLILTESETVGIKSQN